MSNLVFDFCSTSRVIEEMPPEEPSMASMNGWDFTAKPKIPYRREFKVRLDGMTWYLNDAANALDITTDPTHNAGKLLDFYKAHRMWDSFLFNHEYAGQIRVRFSKPVMIPAGLPDTGGYLDSLEVNLLEHSPSF